MIDWCKTGAGTTANFKKKMPLPRYIVKYTIYNVYYNPVKPVYIKYLFLVGSLASSTEY